MARSQRPGRETKRDEALIPRDRNGDGRIIRATSSGPASARSTSHRRIQKIHTLRVLRLEETTAVLRPREAEMHHAQATRLRSLGLDYAADSALADARAADDIASMLRGRADRKRDR